jgi:putative FmdB family regulatory protein
MPIYEFFCAPCHRIFSFRARRVDTVTRPRCPRCAGDTLERRVSTFAVLSADHRAREENDAPPFDDARMAGALERMGGEIDTLDENNPRALARFMRRFSRESGMEFGETYERALQRLEQGEDPDTVEAELGAEDADADEVFRAVRDAGSGRRHGAPPLRDDALYDM